MSNKIKYTKSWSNIPDWISRGNLISTPEKALLIKVLANSWGFHMSCYHKKITFKELGREIGMNDRAVSKNMKLLRDRRKLINFKNEELKMISVNMSQMELYDDLFRKQKNTSRKQKNEISEELNDTQSVKKQHSPPLNKDITKDKTKDISKEEIDFLDFEKKWLFKEKLNIEATKRAWYDQTLNNQKLIIKTLEHSQQTYKEKADTDGSPEFLPQAHIYIAEGRYKKFLKSVGRDDWADEEYKKTIALRGLYNHKGVNNEKY
jgi:hypothetical protein